jgi:RND family efflux transporter MFP subunit
MSERRRSWRIAAAAVVAGALLALAFWWLDSGRPEKVRTALVASGPAVELVYATGFVEPAHPVSVAAQVTAPVTQVLVDEGQAVTRGQPLVRLDSAEQQALLSQAEAEARGKTLTEGRVATLYRQGWVTRAARDEAVALGQSARAARDALAARAAQTTVRAGLAGIILKRSVEPGDLATPGRELLQIGNPHDIRINATVDERDIPRVRIGQSALLSSDALPGRPIEARVTAITPGGDPNQRAFRVRLSPSSATELPFGLTLEVNIVTARHDGARLVPNAAITPAGIWVVSNGRAELRRARIGIAGAQRSEVLSGLRSGETVVVSPPPGLANGDKVRQ